MNIMTLVGRVIKAIIRAMFSGKKKDEREKG